MTENVENLLLEHMKRFEAAFERIERTLGEHSSRLASLEAGQALIVQHIAHLASADAAQQVAYDSLASRLDRIERRLELTH